jgi:hypothetical protein
MLLENLSIERLLKYCLTYFKIIELKGFLLKEKY